MAKVTPKIEKPKYLVGRGRKRIEYDYYDPEVMKFLVLKGFTDKEICLVYQIDEQTLNNWKHRDKRFFESLKDWKNEADYKVERSLYESACGFTVKNKKAVVVSDGKDAGSHVEMVDEYIQYPPNPTSCIFWLKNRKPAEWRDRQEIDHNIRAYLHEEFADKSDEELMNDVQQFVGSRN